jgi:hypothetical protein
MGLNMNLRKDNIGKILNSLAVQAELKRRADRIAAAAGEGMLSSVQAGKNRARASVITATPQARNNEARNRALTRALDAGR